MSWIVRNTLRGTLELHGFSKNKQAIRIAGNKLFDLDSISLGREYIEKSKQIETAFKEGYLITVSKSENASDTVEKPKKHVVEDSGLSLWQKDMQAQVSEQSANVSELMMMMKTFIEALSTKEDQGQMDADRLVNLMKNEIQTQIKLVARNEAQISPSSYQTENLSSYKKIDNEAVNRARLSENLYEKMNVNFDPQKNVAVKTFVQRDGKTSGMVDLLSNLDNQ